MANEKQISAKIAEIIRWNLGLSNDRVIDDITPLTDILSNSVEFIQIIVDIEDEYNIEFKNEELSFQSFHCIGDLVLKTQKMIESLDK